MAQPTVLKPKHTLVGKSLIPIITKTKATFEDGVEFARLKKEYPLEDYSLSELRTEFERLTGESVKDVIPLAGREDNLEGVRILMHFAIVHDNILGAPKGQPLQQPVAAAANSPSKDKESPSVESGADVSPAASDTASQLKTMRKDLDALKTQKEGVQVDEALATVRTLANRPKLTSPNILMAAIEHLVEISNKTNYKDATLFSKSLSICKKYEDHEDFCSLVLKLYGSQEDKKISSVLADWAKSKKYETEKTKSKDKENVNPAPGYAMPNVGFPTIQPYQVPYGYPPMMLHGHQFQPMVGGFGPRMPIRGRSNRKRNDMTCFFCKETGHFVSNCPKMKKN